MATNSGSQRTQCLTCLKNSVLECYNFLVSETRTLTRETTKAATPKLWKVMLLNDDYTPMDFVVDVLTRVFRKSEDEAIQIMLQVHHAGAGLAGVYAFEIAETKIMQTEDLARSEGHPLQCTLEPE
jgi:ATP-dependent Clp protease adaptor protein ClpS